MRLPTGPSGNWAFAPSQHTTGDAKDAISRARYTRVSASGPISRRFGDRRCDNKAPSSSLHTARPDNLPIAHHRLRHDAMITSSTGTTNHTTSVIVRRFIIQV